MTKNATVERRVSEGVFFDPATNQEVEDIQELELVKAIVVSAHNLHR